MFQPITKNDSISPDLQDARESGVSRCLVCGLGSLGQYCVAQLKEFGVTVSGIDVTQPRVWGLGGRQRARFTGRLSVG